MRKNKPGGLPILLFGLGWALCALALPLYTIFGLLLTAAFALSLCLLAVRRGKKRRKAEENAAPVQEQTPPAPAEEKKKSDKETRYSPEVNAIMDEGKLAMREMGRLYGSIGNPEIKSKINRIMAVSDRIIRDAAEDPSDVPQIRKFLDFYLPTTIKLLNAYDRMSSQDIDGENIANSKQRIEDMLDTTIDAYEKQLDALFANQAADIQTDIDVMNAMLAREGLGGKGYLDIKDFMKQYEKRQNEQKGSTANG